MMASGTAPSFGTASWKIAFNDSQPHWLSLEIAFYHRENTDAKSWECQRQNDGVAQVLKKAFLHQVPKYRLSVVETGSFFPIRQLILDIVPFLEHHPDMMIMITSNKYHTVKVRHKSSSVDLGIEKDLR
jgi:hypothetical protein